MITAALSSIYGAAAVRRRRWYARHPEAVRRLARPVVSVGNLRVGGTGKTPIVAAIARELVARGERPAVLTRGYARRVSLNGVTVVSDGHAVLADFDVAGDEPLMLARQLPGIAVLVGFDRYLSGRLAERQFGVTVHILDDGFQHLQLEREVDLIVAGDADLHDRVLPAGRLREPREAARAADAVLVAGAAADARRVGDGLGIAEAFAVTRTLDAVPAEPAFAVAGIARPERFFADLRSRGARVVGTMAFADHHRFSPGEMVRIAAAARDGGAAVIVTTEKDAVRLPAEADGLPVVTARLTTTIEGGFGDWLMTRLA